MREPVRRGRGGRAGGLGVVTALAALLLPAPAAQAQFENVLTKLDFKWVVQSPGRDPKGATLAQAAAGIDVDGSPGADLKATVVPVAANTFQLSITKQRPGRLLARVELVSGKAVTDGRFVAYGYDVQAGAGAPESFSSKIQTPGGDAVIVDAGSTTGQPVKVVADLFIPDDPAAEQEDFTREAPRTTVNYGPIGGRGDTLTHLEARVIEPSAAKKEIRLVNNQPATAFARIEEVTGSAFKTIAATVKTVPSSLTVTTTEASGELDALEYAANGPIDDALVRFDEGTKTDTRRITARTADVTLLRAPVRLKVAGLRALDPLTVEPRDASGTNPQEVGFVDVVFGDGGEICKGAGRKAGVPRDLFCRRPARTATGHTVSRFDGKDVDAIRATLVGLLNAELRPDGFAVDAAFSRPRPLNATLLSAPRGRAIDRTISIRAADVPVDTHVEADVPEFKRVNFTGSDAIGSLRVDASDRRRKLFELGKKDKPKTGDETILIDDLDLALTDVPKALTVNRFENEAEGNVIEACSIPANPCPDVGRASIGKIEARLSGRKSIRAPVGRPVRTRPAAIRSVADGVELRDFPGTFDLFARVSGFRRLAVLNDAEEGQDPTRRFAVDSIGDRVFEAEIPKVGEPVTVCQFIPPRFKVQKRFLKRPLLRAQLDSLKPNTVLTIKETARGEKDRKDNQGCVVKKGNEKKSLRIGYQADAPARRLTVSTNEGSRNELVASVGGTLAGETLPVPSRLDFCTDDEAGCARDVLINANRGSTSIDADRHTLIQMRDCKLPIDKPCSKSKEFVKITDLRVRRFILGLNVRKFAGLETKADIGLHTVPSPFDPAEGDRAKEVSGKIVLRKANAGFIAGFQGADVNFPRGFFAENRKAGFSFFTIDPEGLGHAECPDGVNFLVRLNNAADIQLRQEICAK